MELLAVVIILGVFAAVAASRLGPGTVVNVGARTHAQRLAVDLLQAKRRSIATGENHYLAFTTGGGGSVTGYTLYRRSVSQGNVAVDEPYQFPSDVVVWVSHNEAEFTFEGSALASYQVSLAGPEQTWQVDVVPTTGLARVAEVQN